MNSIPIQVIELLNHSCSIAKFLLNKPDECFPFGMRIDYKGKTNKRLVHDGDEFPFSHVLIEQSAAVYYLPYKNTESNFVHFEAWRSGK
nr:hypothetical protein [uncultured Pedobacter sp.]